MYKKRFSSLAEEFESECCVFDMFTEYGNSYEEKKFIIATDLNEFDLEEKYGTFLNAYKPFICVAFSYVNIRQDYCRNEEKHRKRLERSFRFNTNDKFYEYCLEKAIPDFSAHLFDDDHNNLLIHQAIEILPPAEKRRIIKRYFYNYTQREISAQENVSESMISQSLKSAMQKIKLFLEDSYDF